MQYFPPEMYVYLLFWVLHPTREFFTHLETSPASNVDLYSATEQRGFFNVPHLLRQGASVYMVISRCDTHTCCRAFGSAAATTCFYDFGLCRSWDLNIQPSTCEAKVLTDCATAPVRFWVAGTLAL